jgi:hypothetical protein
MLVDTWLGFRGNMECNDMEYLIRSDHERDYATGEPLYWSNEDGWVDKTHATVFAENEMKYLNLPMTGEWVQYE